jgi:hypothetical protein
VVARFLFTLALENPSCGQQSFESGIIEGRALAHAEIASIERDGPALKTAMTTLDSAFGAGVLWVIRANMR